MKKDVLDQLHALLKRKSMTVAEIAKATGCCKPTAYKRVRALLARGVGLTETVVVVPGKTGPVAKLFSVVDR